jgi:hypothetical protein
LTPAGIPAVKGKIGEKRWRNLQPISSMNLRVGLLRNDNE